MTRTVEVRNRIGVVVYTANDARLARAWARDRSRILGDLTIDEVTIPEPTRKRITTVRAPRELETAQ